MPTCYRHILAAPPLRIAQTGSAKIYDEAAAEPIGWPSLPVFLAIVVSPSNLIGLPMGIWALVVLSQRDVRAAFRREPFTRGTSRFALKVLCVVIGTAVLVAVVALGPSQYRVYRFRRSFVAEMMWLLPPTYHDASQPKTGPLEGVEIFDLVHSKYGEQGDRYVVQSKITYEGLRTTSTCELVGDRWGRYCGEWGGFAGYPRMNLFVGNWGADSLPSTGGQSAGVNAAAGIGFGPVIKPRWTTRTAICRQSTLPPGKVLLRGRVRQRVTRAESYASFRNWMRDNGMDAVGQADEPIRGLFGGKWSWHRSAAIWDNPSIMQLWEGLVGGAPTTPAAMTVSGTLPTTFGFATRIGSISGIVQIVGFLTVSEGVKIRYRLVQGSAIALGAGRSRSRPLTFDITESGPFGPLRPGSLAASQ